MELGTIRTEDGAIRIGAERSPTTITGSPHYVHDNGDIEITQKAQDGAITVLSTSRGDILRYKTTGEVTLEATQGAIRDLTDTTLPADYLKLVAVDVSVKSAAVTTDIYRNIGDIIITASNPLDSNLVTIEGVGINVTYYRSNNVTLQSDNTVATAEGVIIAGNQVKVLARYFGVAITPLAIEAITTYIKTDGEMNILQSTGIGTSVMITGPPGGFGQILYSH